MLLTHTYAVAGTYHVQATVTDLAGRSTAASATATVGGKSGSFSFLSDRAVRNQSDDPEDGSGVYQTDESAATLSGGGHPAIQIGKAVYAKGFGIQATASLRSALLFSLDGNYTTFASDIGMDAASSKGSAVEFRVYADDKEIFSTGRMTSASGVRSVSLNVAGAKTLELIILNDGGDSASNFADWAGAHLISTVAAAAHDRNKA